MCFITFINIILYLRFFSYYRGSNGILLVYDITQRSTYEHIDRWLKEIREHEYNYTEDAVIILVGNKTDLEQSRAVSTEEAQKFAGQYPKNDYMLGPATIFHLSEMEI